ncbi:MAG: LacI family DNA-binding transcriptional regulator [Treponema sp.]|jgi:LacI family transcriptional regulator|nr:LacI family DNA-binding transcriptional regulator [Treponema sp.]
MTVHEIAELAGVSIGTVDRVLYKRGRVSAATRARVEAIIEQYQFTPNPIARRLKRNRPYRFCAFIPRRDQDAGYWGLILAGIERAAKEIRPLGVETETAEFDRYDFADFERIASRIWDQKPDGLLFAPIMPEQTRPFVERLCAESFPMIFIDADMPGTAPLSVIVQDPLKGGYLAGRLFHLFAGTVTGPVAVLDAHGEDYHITRRRDGFLHYAAERDFPVVVRDYSDYQGTDLSVEEIARFLKEEPELSGVFITNCMAYRVAEAAADRRQGDRTFLVVGYDLIPNNHRLLREGRIDAIISQRPEEQGREALLTLFRSVVLEQPVESRREIPLDVYIKENAPA